MRGVSRDQRKRQPRPLTARELTHRQIRLVAGKSEATELRESNKTLRKLEPFSIRLHHIQRRRSSWRILVG
jgi:hypothetical protein